MLVNIKWTMQSTYHLAFKPTCGTLVFTHSTTHGSYNHLYHLFIKLRRKLQKETLTLRCDYPTTSWSASWSVGDSKLHLPFTRKCRVHWLFIPIGNWHYLPFLSSIKSPSTRKAYTPLTPTLLVSSILCTAEVNASGNMTCLSPSPALKPRLVIKLPHSMKA